MEPRIPPAKMAMDYKLLFESLIIINSQGCIQFWLHPKCQCPLSSTTHAHTDTHRDMFEIRRSLRREEKGKEILLALLHFLLVWSILVFLYISLVALPGSRTTQLCYQGTFAAPECFPPGDGQGRGIYHERGRCSEAAHSIQKLFL